MKNLMKLFILGIACAISLISLVSCGPDGGNGGNGDNGDNGGYTPPIQAADDAQQTSMHDTLVNEGLGNVFPR